MPESSLARQIPESAYTDALRIRSYEVGRMGRVRAGTMLRYIEHLATEASADRGFDNRWYEESGAAWVVREMSLLLGVLPGIADELRMATWLSEVRRVQAFREYAVWHGGLGRLAARARGRWAYVDRIRGQPVRISDELMESFGVLGHPMRSRSLAGMDLATTPGPVHEMQLVAREYEADSQGHINNCVYVDWLDEALLRALGRTPLQNQLSRVRPRFYHIEYLRQMWPGTEVRIATRLFHSRSRSLLASQEITDAAEGTVVMRAQSEHLFLAPPPGVSAES